MCPKQQIQQKIDSERKSLEQFKAFAQDPKMSDLIESNKEMIKYTRARIEAFEEALAILND